MTEQAEWCRAPIPDAASELSRRGYSARSAELLARRGIADGAGAETFFHPRVADLHDPRELLGLDAAVERLLAARERGERIAVVGDYDVDGVAGTALLAAVLGACGLEIETILPHRMRDGYGFQPCHVERARDRRCALVVTVDCGTSSHAAVAAALDAGLDVVVTDHHLPGDEPLPAGVILINPRQDGCAYPFAELSGAGLALKLALAFAAACERPLDPRILLRIACLGTIADLVPLRDENRVIAAIGLRELARTRSAGLRALFGVSGVAEPYSTSDVGYRLAPRLNAPGRLDSADKALELLLCRDVGRATTLAGEIDEWNRERQRRERQAFSEAREHFLARDPLPPILVAWSEDWHRGVVGIAAGRLARELHRPTILLALDGDLATGSGRSVEGVHLFDFLAPWRRELERFGGHAQAIGMSVSRDRLEDLRRRWEDAAAVWSDKLARRRYEYELDLEPREVDAELLSEIERFEPFGAGNPRPLVRVRGPLELARPPRIFGHGHLRAEAVAPDGGRIRLLGWGWQARSAELTTGFEALGFLEQDRYFAGPVLRLVACRPHGAAGGENPEPTPQPDMRTR